jgi:hypothetical protein
VWEGERGRQRGEVESECFRVWEGERGRHRGGIKSVCVRVWEGDKERHGREVERECDILRGRERNMERGVERES